MKLKLLFTLPIICLFLLSSPAKASDTMVFDSTDRYLGACQLTDKSTWTLSQDIAVTTFQVWYNWNQNETTLPVKIYKDDTLFAEFEATRSSCDPYQKQWCNADYVINKTFPKGTYTTQIPNARQCLKPGGTGAIRLYSADSAPTSAPLPSSTPVPTTIPTAVPVVPAVVAPVCKCNQFTTIATSAGVSSLLSLIISWLLRRK